MTALKVCKHDLCKAVNPIILKPLLLAYTHVMHAVQGWLDWQSVCGELHDMPNARTLAQAICAPT